MRLLYSGALATARRAAAAGRRAGKAFAATPFPGFQAAGFSSSRPQSWRSLPRGFSLSVSSWVVAPFCSWAKEKSSRFKIEMAAPGSWCLCCVVVTQQFLFWRRMADYYGSFSKSFGY
ncbi:MAG TPA: hypothetical protein H9795_04190 [Candidatus Fournierella merdigallinarum]|nr:hypothetical protein [Candidatus Fournierella merdigallinarum]